jgi:dTMP kinase
VPLITFEGVEGCGKSTQLRSLAERLSGTGRSVVATREPGGTETGHRIRAILLDPSETKLDSMAEWLLFEADRRQHVVELLAPALSQGRFVLCDRFSDSTEAYQRAGRGLDAGLLRRVDEIVRGGIASDLTLLYDLDPREGLERTRRRDAGEPSRFDSAPVEFHDRVREAFLEIARREPDRIVIIPATGEASEIAARTWDVVSARFGL